jgi:hypothetical protein
MHCTTLINILCRLHVGEIVHTPVRLLARASHQLGEHVDRHARAAKRRIPAHDLAYLPILGRRSGRAD